VKFGVPLEAWPEELPVPAAYVADETGEVLMASVDPGALPQDLRAYQSMALLTGDRLVMPDNKSLNLGVLKWLPDMTITRESLLTQLALWQQNPDVGRWLVWGWYAVPGVVFLAYTAYYAMIIGVAAGVMWGMGKLMRIRLEFGKLYGFWAVAYLVPACALLALKWAAVEPAIRAGAWVVMHLTLVALAWGLLALYRKA
jgi:hypothetical protein